MHNVCTVLPVDSLRVRNNLLDTNDCLRDMDLLKVCLLHVDDRLDTPV